MNFLHLCVISCGGSVFGVISISFFLLSEVWLVRTKKKENISATSAVPGQRKDTETEARVSISILCSSA